MAGPVLVPPAVFSERTRVPAALAPLVPLFVLDVLTAFTVGMVPPLLSINHLAAIGMEDLPRHIRRIVAGKKHKARSNLFGLTGALHRHIAAKRRHMLSREGRRN